MTAVGLALVIASPTSAMAAPSPSGRGLAVSIPADPTPAPKGATVRIPIRIVNPGSEPVSVSIVQREVLLGDNGRVSIGSSADPQWRGRVTFLPPTATLGARQYANVVIVVQVPVRIASDLQFVGFLVSPVAIAQGQVSVINQIGSFVTLDVPGPRRAGLQVTLRIPSFTLARQAYGSLQVVNVGHSAVRFWGENDTTSWPGGATPDQQRLDTSLAPVATTRSLAVTARPDWPVGFVQIQGQIIYPSATGSATTQVAFSRRVLVIDPWVIIVAAVLLLAAAFQAGTRQLRRRGRRRSSAPRTPDPAGRSPSGAR
jgi:hypothetical protein